MFMFGDESIERANELKFECDAIKKSILKSAENLHLDPSHLADELIKAFIKVNQHYHHQDHAENDVKAH